MNSTSSPQPITRAGVLTPDGARLAEVLARIARRLTSDNRPADVKA
jgi:hypothetical protein